MSSINVGENENNETSKYREEQEMKEKNAELLFQMASQEQAMRKMQRGFEIVFEDLPWQDMGNVLFKKVTN